MPDRPSIPGDRRNLPACAPDMPCPVGDSLHQQLSDLQNRYDTLLRCVEGQTVVITAIRGQLDQLYETVYTGNGEPSLLVQLSRMIEAGAGIRAAVSDLDAAVARLGARIETDEAKIDSRLSSIEREGCPTFRQFAGECRTASREASKRNTMLIIAIISTLLGVLGTLLTNYIQGSGKL